MTIQDLGALGEFIGSVAVLATLVYLTLQTRQNTMAISSQVDAARISATTSISMAIATSGDLLKAIAEDSSDPRMASPEAVRLGAYFRGMFNNFQWQFVQGRRGLLPTYSEALMEETVRSCFRGFRSFAGWWATEGVLMVPEFVAWVEEQRAKAD